MKILLADDHTLFRDGMLALIERAEPTAEVVCAESFDEAMRIVRGDPVWDIILLDLHMGGMNGPAGIGVMRSAVADVPVALMSGMATQEEIRGALDNGAIGFVPKTLSSKALMTAIRLMLSGEPFVPYSAISETPARPEREPAPPPPGSNPGLTERERQVLALLCRGQSNKAIAREIGLQEVTVKLHVRGICRKLNAANRTQAVIRAHDLGLATL